jgi:hypothetical protein
MPRCPDLPSLVVFHRSCLWHHNSPSVYAKLDNFGTFGIDQTKKTAVDMHENKNKGKKVFSYFFAYFISIDNFKIFFGCCFSTTLILMCPPPLVATDLSAAARGDECSDEPREHGLGWHPPP